jgi:hypothetical protein
MICIAAMRMRLSLIGCVLAACNGGTGPMGQMGDPGMPGMNGMNGVSQAYVGQSSSSSTGVNIDVAPTTITTMMVPAGTYVVNATMSLNANGDTTGTGMVLPIHGECLLLADTNMLDTEQIFLFTSDTTPAMLQFPMALQGTATSANPISLTIVCTRAIAGTSLMQAASYTISAIQVDTVHYMTLP